MKPSKRNLQTILVSPSFVISIFPPLTFFIFGWITLYLTNYQIFEFSLMHIVSIGGLTAIIISAFLFSISIGMKRLKIEHFYLALLLGFGIGLYVQGNFLNNNFGLLDGQKIAWSRYSLQGNISSVVWAFIILIPVIIALIKKNICAELFRNISIVFLVVQLISIGTQLFLSGNTFWKNEVSKRNSTILQITTENQFDFSSKSNTIVLIVDALDYNFIYEILAEDDSYTNIFRDFTLFSNVVGKYTTTNIAVPHIITGQGYLYDMPYDEYISNAYSKSEILKTLQNNNYNVGIYTSRRFVGKSNIITNQHITKSTLTNPAQFIKLISRLTSFRYMPQFLKHYFEISTSEFSGLMGSKSNYEFWTQSNFTFYDDMIKEEFTASLDEPVFRLYHIQGSHEPYTMTADCSQIKDSTPIEQTKGVFKIIDTFLYKMREIGIYDNANIIILADHGRLGLKQNPGCLIKRAHSFHPLLRNDSPISYAENLTPTILSLIENNNQVTGKTFFDINDKQIGIERTVFTPINTVLTDEDYYYNIYGYSSVGHAGDVRSFFQNGTFISPESVKLGYPIRVGQAVNAASIVDHPLWGWGNLDIDNSRYCLGWETPFVLNMEKIPDDDMILTISIEMGILYPGEFELRVNGNSVGFAQLNSDKDNLQFLIPRELINNDSVLLFTLHPSIPDELTVHEFADLATFRCKTITLEESKGRDVRNNFAKDEWHLVPRNLDKAEVIEKSSNSVIIHRDGARGGYYITMPSGEYEMIVIGSNIKQASCFIPNEFRENSYELERSDSKIVIRFSIDQLTKNCNFIVGNKTEQDIVVDDVILKMLP